MAKNETPFQFFYSRLLSEEVRKKSEHIIIAVAIISFILHLLIVILVNLNILHVNEYSSMFTNPIAAIYTPFSFILIYEVYLLVFYLPKSTTIYIGKQYEIITLILIRGIKFHKVIRNSGFIISTILIKLSFGSEGLLNTILIVAAVSFGVIILLIHNQYRKIDFSFQKTL